MTDSRTFAVRRAGVHRLSRERLRDLLGLPGDLIDVRYDAFRDVVEVLEEHERHPVVAPGGQPPDIDGDNFNAGGFVPSPPMPCPTCEAAKERNR